MVKNIITSAFGINCKKVLKNSESANSVSLFFILIRRLNHGTNHFLSVIVFSFYSIIFPSIFIVTTCHGMNFPLFCSAFFAAISRPPQHGTSILTIVTL